MAVQGTILVIDDEAAMRDCCCQALAPEGYRTETASDGNAGLEQVRRVKPDLVLVDLKMPGMSGMQLLEKIAETDPNIVSIVITGYATIESAVDAMKRNAYDFLPKPFTPDQLRLIVARGLERRRLVAESTRLRQEKDRMRRNFVTLVTHQLRAPLASVRQYLWAIQAGYGARLADPSDHTVETLGKQIDDLLRLIADWLDLSRIEAGKMTEAFGEVAVGPVLRETIESLRPMADARKVALELDVGAGDNSSVIQGDAGSLKQAFANLVGNAIQYNREAGRVTVGVREEADDVVIEFSDTGIGISQEDMPFIFDEFFRVQDKRKAGVSGSGLGLPITKRIIEAHGGSINVVSQIDRGSTFVVRLPRIKNEQRKRQR